MNQRGRAGSDHARRGAQPLTPDPPGPRPPPRRGRARFAEDPRGRPPRARRRRPGLRRRRPSRPAAPAGPGGRPDAALPGSAGVASPAPGGPRPPPPPRADAPPPGSTATKGVAPGHLEQVQPVCATGADQWRGRPPMGQADTEPERDHPGLDEPADVAGATPPLQPRRVQPGGEQDLAALEEGRRVDELAGGHPTQLGPGRRAGRSPPGPGRAPRAGPVPTSMADMFAQRMSTGLLCTPAWSSRPGLLTSACPTPSHPGSTPCPSPRPSSVDPPCPGAAAASPPSPDPRPWPCRRASTRRCRRASARRCRSTPSQPGAASCVDVDGNSLIDLGSGIAVTTVGNSAPRVAAAVAEQVAGVHAHLLHGHAVRGLRARSPRRSTG